MNIPAIYCSFVQLIFWEIRTRSGGNNRTNLRSKGRFLYPLKETGREREADRGRDLGGYIHVCASVCMYEYVCV